MKKYITMIIIFIIGLIIGISIANIPIIRYDLNGNGKIDVGDEVKLINYIVNH